MEATRPLRWYSGIAVVVFGIVPVVMLILLVTGGHTPGSVGLLLIGGIPLVIGAGVLALRGMRDDDPEAASRHLHLSLALVAGADLLMLGGNALIRMGS
ncbi:hypothetical protein OWR29_46530 [Actinoplanes sp. Pm04-4]|jgi:hypothetical protein|uniref:Uncharacterized protein n=1 Tax=Paractinoplanes pyxinae TaxID=2997416 RepID=A0ABT4BG33_9ACTN|nr:hypothetical protein [Actinoplanes pyxinae]MCY1145507.1 hypothetical protein [Actinoplanes pyxinae]